MASIAADGIRRFKSWVGGPQTFHNPPEYRATKTLVKKGSEWRVVHSHFSVREEGPGRTNRTCLGPELSPRMTFSIVATDMLTGEMGVAIATARPAVGALCTFAVPGVGVVATQAIVNPQLAISALEDLARGADAQSAMHQALGLDSESELRQLLVADAKGTAAAFTGEKVKGWAGAQKGEGFAAGGNLLVGGDVVSNMAATFAASTGHLADRLMAALLAAADATGGDRRGRRVGGIAGGCSKSRGRR